MASLASVNRLGALLRLTTIVILLAAAVTVLFHRWKPSTAPSLRVDLISCTNVSTMMASRKTAFLVSPVSNPPTRKDATFKVFNRGDRPVRIEKEMVIEERPTGVHLDLDLNVNRLIQTNVVGFVGTLQSGESRTVIVRFYSMSGSFVGEGGPIHYELRGVCQTTPAELDLRLMKWLKGQVWSKYMPRGLLKEGNSYIFSSAWVPEAGSEVGIASDSY